MLGTGSGYVSQAFLVEALMKLMTPNGIWADALNMLINHDKHYNYVALELIAFFASVKSTFNDIWPTGEEPKPTSIICKTTGLGALILLLSELHKSINDKMLDQVKADSFSNASYAMMKAYYLAKLEPLKSYTKELFSLDGKYAGGAGFGQQRSLYNRMIEIISE